jgi:UDP-2-acetamido-3-amino-2,3-dideoxy-glucuronate N-acetyltransferase
MSQFFIHPAALVESNHIGSGTKIWAFTHVLSGARIGARCNIGDHCFIEADVVIGDDVTIKNGNSIWNGVTIGDGVFVGPDVSFTNDLHPRSPRLPAAASRYEGTDWLVPTYVEEGATLGAGSVILAGKIIRRFAMVGAGSVVTRDVPSHALVLGHPATCRGWMCECGTRLDFQESVGTCQTCGRQYKQGADGVRRV